jgi:hypothetical protein
MSLKITPFPTASGLSRAISASEGGFELKVKYIAVGKGLQAIELDDAGRATTESLADLVGYLEVLKAKRVNDYQWQMVVDLRSVQEEEWNFSEFALCDADKQVIAIYGNETQALISVTPALDNALLAVNLVLATFPADSVIIEHHNLPLELFFYEEFKAVHLATTSNALDILRLRDDVDSKAAAAEFGIVSAFQNLTQSTFNQETLQAGILSTRQYNYHGEVDSMRRVWDRTYNPGGSHNHANYDRMSGNAETTAITPTGHYIRMRHADYRYKQSIQHNDFLKTEDVPLPEVPNSILNAGSLDEQISAMRALYARYKNGEFPTGFKFVLTYIETWVEPFTGDVTDPFDSFRHQQQINKVVDQFRLNKVYTNTGLKDRFENLPINQVFVAGLEDNGKPILGILKGRFVCRDLEALGDLRPWIEIVDDPVMDVYRGIKNERFKIKENPHRPGKLDEIMSMVAGLDGEGAYLEEVHYRYNNTEKIKNWGTSKIQNAAYYHRWGSAASGASNRSNYQAGFNIPNFFKAMTSREEVLPVSFGDRQYKTSWAMPYELTLYHPAMNWNPYQLTVNNKEKGTGSGRGSLENPYDGINPNGVWYKTPNAFYTGNSVSDIADTGAGLKWVRGPRNIAHPVRASGIYIKLPNIKGVGSLRMRYPIYHRPQDASYESSLTTALHRRNLNMTDTLSAELTKGLIDQIEQKLLINNLQRKNTEKSNQLNNDINAKHERNLNMTDKLTAEITHILGNQITKLGETV